MTDRGQQLIRWQRAEFTRASSRQQLLLGSQAAIAVLSSAAVLAASETFTYVAAVIAASLSVISLWLDSRYRVCRDSAERARRASLLIEGLGQKISENEWRELKAAFSVSETQVEKFLDENYYAAGSAAGEKRLAEMLHESAFWSSHLLRSSAEWVWAGVIITFFAGLFFLMLAIPHTTTTQLQGTAEIFCSLLVLLVSRELAGAAVAYRNAAAEASKLLPRLEAIRQHDYTRADLMLTFSDYNAIVQGAPMFVPGVYRKNQERLNKLWAEQYGEDA